jgi:proline dehydrogenase
MPGTGGRWTVPDLQSAVDLCRMRNSQRITCTIAYLAGTVQSDEQASQTMESYLSSIEAIDEQKLKASITVKPTALGALLNKARCTELLITIFRKAVAHNVWFEIATEGKELVQYTVEAAVACAKEGNGVTLALQAYLNRSSEDLKIIIDNGISPRLVKGAYLGDTNDYPEIQERFKKLAEMVLENRHPLLVGTHDPELLRWLTKRMVSNRKSIEFGFLMGLADRTKLDLAGQGWKVLEYIPFGKNIESYESRRWKFLKDLERLGRSPVS